MAKYRNQLPQLNGGKFITDGGLETSLIFHEGLNLPCFAAFDLLKDAAGYQLLQRYFEPYCETARQQGFGFILESVTWRASEDWGRQLGYDLDALDGFNRRAIAFLSGLRERYETDATPMVISGCIGPRGDGYSAYERLGAAEAERYHARQIRTFADTDADMVSAFTMTHTEEAIGITRAAMNAGIPAVISFTLETDSRLPSGEPLGEAIERVDADTDNGPAYYMINCAHPTHFEAALQGQAWLNRIHGVRANASSCSHAELDEAEELDDGNPGELGEQYKVLRRKMAGLNVIGGCCGTDHRHVSAMCGAF